MSSAGEINNFGYVAPFDYQRGADAIVVLGDSYVESMMNPYEQTLQANIQRAVRPDLAVLNFGSSGSSLADYLGMATLVRAAFKPEWVVVLITEGDYREGFARSPGYFHWSDRPPELTALTPDRERRAVDKIARRLGLVRYVRGNLRMSSRALFGAPTVAKPRGADVRARDADAGRRDADPGLCGRAARSLRCPAAARDHRFRRRNVANVAVCRQRGPRLPAARRLSTSAVDGPSSRERHARRRHESALRAALSNDRAPRRSLAARRSLERKRPSSRSRRRTRRDAVRPVGAADVPPNVRSPTMAAGDATVGATSSPLSDRYRAQLPNGGQC